MRSWPHPRYSSFSTRVPLPTNLEICRQDAKLAKVDLLTKNLNFLGGLGVLAVNFLKLLALPLPPAGFWC